MTGLVNRSLSVFGILASGGEVGAERPTPKKTEVERIVCVARISDGWSNVSLFVAACLA